LKRRPLSPETKLATVHCGGGYHGRLAPLARPVPSECRWRRCELFRRQRLAQFPCAADGIRAAGVGGYRAPDCIFANIAVAPEAESLNGLHGRGRPRGPRQVSLRVRGWQTGYLEDNLYWCRTILRPREPGKSTDASDL
jgi:hypothetical protein